mmetsp:Transcript_67941/g.192513  ORF Transcript_67941/g.192513 Transcript_67941/m.192513 type:complete len:283 (-) Transcript_67941:64-912(-)|eukprot:CAMPEP_0168454900 /NCGR_PEP_ID=MMETSP0228-20121227/50462_1 /TAXON_ID=133427 /ORGANISM="Protoceratium reticulatum, Strain CCCM 535 (=CCMP 1889)" /LENGTH=282 /DNA_ID=CAMNT_0008469707 /DNA_START=73 /DNA_END=921 /DNA_ORIENTATION=+
MRADRVLLILLGFHALQQLRCQDDLDEENAEVDDQDIDEESLSGDQLRRLHSKFDANGDSKVSLHEVLQFSQGIGKAIAGKDIGAILEEIDTSKDGRLSLEEHLSDIHNQADGGDEEEMKELEQRKRVEAAKFQAADVNGDQVLDAKELPALFYPETHDGVLAVTVQETMRQKDANSDGVLTQMEFWEADPADGEEAELSEEEQADFAKLDLDGNGVLNFDELKSWESGRFHTEEAVKKLFEIADKDHDMHVTADELAEAKEQIAASDAQYHLIEWAEHHEL